MTTPRRKDLDSASYRKNRETFLTEWDGACHWCKRARATTIDHVIEQDRGADPTDQSNWVGACHKCNSRRGAEYLAKKRAATVQARTKSQNENQKSKNIFGCICFIINLLYLLYLYFRFHLYM